MSNDQRNAEFSFLDFARHSRTPGPAEPSKKRGASASVVALPVRKSKTYASDSKGEILATAVIAALVLILAKWFGQ